MDQHEKEFRMKMARSIRVFDLGAKLFHSRKRVHAILKKLENFQFQTDHEKIYDTTSRIRRFLKADELGAVRREFRILRSVLKGSCDDKADYF